SFSANSCTLSGSGASASCSVTFTGTAAGAVTVTGTYSADSTHTTSQNSFTLQVTDFSLQPSSPVTINCTVGVPCSTTIAGMSLNGFVGSVSLTANPSSGLSATLGKSVLVLTSGGTDSTTLSFSPSTINTSGSSTLTVSGSVAGSYSVNVTAASGSISHSFLVTVTVTPPTGAKEPIITQFNFKHHLSLSKNGFAQTFRVGIFNNN